LAFIQEVFKKIRSEIGGVYPEITSASNEIVVRGEKKRVDAAKQEITKQLEVLVKSLKQYKPRKCS
jgi:hypothetical protein